MAADKRQFQEQLEDEIGLNVRTYSTASEVLEYVKTQNHVDCIVSDHTLPDLDGITLLQTIRVQYPELPFILFTDSGDEKLASRAISSGVTDYVIKSQVQDQWEKLRALIIEVTSYYETRQAVTAPELTVKSIFQASPDPMAVVQSGELQYGNEELLSLFNAESLADLADRAPVPCFDAELEESTPEIIESVQQGERVLKQVERRAVALDGTTTAVEVTATAMRWNERSAVLLICRNLSERREREAQLLQFRKAVEASGHAVYITDPEGTIQYVNEAFEEITGYEASEALGSTPRILRSGQMSDEYYETLWGTLTTGEIWEERVINRRKNGEIYYAHQTIAPITDIDENITAFVAVQHDITEQKRREQELREYRRAAQNTDDLLTAVDRNYNFLFANPRYREFHGLSPEADVSDLALSDVLEQDEMKQVEPHLTTVLEGKHSTFETVRTDAEGEKRRLNVQYFPLQNENGDITGVGASMRDITEKRKLIESKQQLAEFRRVMNNVHSSLVRIDSPQDALSSVTNIIASSDLFECTFFALTSDWSSEFVCTSGTELSQQDVREFHTQEYLNAVFEQGILKIDDVTTEPFRQHINEQPSHQGIAIAISYEDEQFGVLTVHTPTEPDIVVDEIELLGQLADDIGLVLHNYALEQRYKTFQEIANRIDDPIMLQDLDGNFEVVNDGVSDYAGLTKSELRGNDEFAFMDSETAKRIQEMKDRVVNDETVINYEVTADLPEKGIRDLSTVRYPHYDNSGSVDGTVAICRDVTEINEYETQMKIMERVLRHNVRNHMTVINGLAEHIQSITASSSASDYAAKIKEHSRQLTNIVDKERRITNLLADPPPTITIDLVSTTEAALTRIHDTYQDVSVSQDFPEECLVEGSVAIEEAITELLENAIVHAESDDPRIEVAIDCDSTAGSVRISDSNPTIPEMEREILWDTSKIEPLYHGQGLGLWLVNYSVRESEGSLTFQANEPQGNEITIQLSKGTENPP
ncbi:Signal transduction regulator [Halapricum desulfuricans]|uniref:Signal transduction regulator n=1 Tax=Halapricum desulfuricans TaxID=2841257 RepID=A0A897NEW7_9EURY|nr:Signal transduction regulator [Halapricum desulfuricans]